MRSGVLTALSAMLVGAFFASAVSAATTVVAAGSGAAPAKLIPYAPGAFASATGTVDLAAGSVAVMPGSQDAFSSRPNLLLTNVAPGVQVEVGQGRNWESFGNLFASPNALSSSYAAGASAYAGATFALGNDLSLKFGHANLDFAGIDAGQYNALTNDLAQRLAPGIRNAGSTTASLDWKFNDWGALGFNASRSTGNGALLGAVTGESAIAGLGETSSVGISARIGFGEGWVTSLNYSEGVAQLDLSNRDQVMKLDPLHSEGYGISFAKQGVFGSDALGLAVSRPLQMYNGNTLSALNSALALSTQQAHESDVALGYVTTFLDGTVALQANAAYQMNAAGTRGQSGVAGVARAKLNF